MENKNITRTDLLNHLIKKHNLKRYLEIGVQNPDQNFNKIECDYKISVDPDPNAKATFQCTSDAYFVHQDKVLNPKGEIVGRQESDYFDLIFIDGLHTAEQVKKDFKNALRILSLNGFIVLHDCNPLKEEHTIVPRPMPTGHWNGDVYKFASAMPKYPFWTVAIDNGCMVIKPENDFFRDGIDWPEHIDWKFFDEYRVELLNLVSWDYFVKEHQITHPVADLMNKVKWD